MIRKLTNHRLSYVIDHFDRFLLWKPSSEDVNRLTIFTVIRYEHDRTSSSNNYKSNLLIFRQPMLEYDKISALAGHSH